MTTKLDSRQSISKDQLEQLVSNKDVELDNILRAIDSEVSIPFVMRETDPTADLVINIGPISITNPETDRNRTITPIGGEIPAFISGTITMDATGAGSATPSAGVAISLDMSANEFLKIGVSINSNGDIYLQSGASGVTEAAAGTPSYIPETYAVGYIVIETDGSNNVQNMTPSKIYQFLGSGGIGNNNGEIKVDLIDRVNSVLPTTAPLTIDFETVVSEDRVLFSNLLTNGNRVYKAEIDGSSITWTAQPDFGGSLDPSGADIVRVKRGGSWELAQFIFDSPFWRWSKVDSIKAVLGSASERWTTAYIDDLIGKAMHVTTNSTDGDVLIDGTEKVDIAAAGGLDVTGGLLQAHMDLRLYGATSGYVDLIAAATTTDYSLTMPPAQGVAGQQLTLNNSLELQWQDLITGFNDWEIISTNTVVNPYDDVGVDTSSGTVDITLPDSPISGERVRIIDRVGNFATNSCFIKTTDASTIEGTVQPLEIDVAYIWAEFVYDAAVNNWIIYGPLAKGDSLTLQDIYDGDTNNLPVTLTTTVSQGNLSITGTEQLDISTAKGMKIRSNTPTGKVLEVENTGIAKNASITSTNVADINATLELRHLNASAPLIKMKGATSGDIDLLVPTVVTPYSIKLPAAQGNINEALLNDGSGNLSWGLPTVGTFLKSIVRSVANIDTTLANNTVTIIKFNSEEEDTNGDYNPATYMYTVPRTGLYNVSAIVVFDHFNEYDTDEKMQIYCKINSTTTKLIDTYTVVSTSMLSTTNTTTLSVSGIVKATAGETISIWGFQTSAVSQDVKAEDGNCFTIEEISESALS